MSLINSLVERLGQDLGLGDLQFAERGLVELLFEGDIAVTIEASAVGDALFLHTPLARAEEDSLAQGALFESLLIANHVGNNPLGMILAIDEGAGELVLSHRFAIDETAEFEDFVAALQQLISRVLELRSVLTPSGESRVPETLVGEARLCQPGLLA